MSSNIKVHFAGCDNGRIDLLALRAAKINYRLFSCYGFIKNKTLDKSFRVDNLVEMKMGFKHVIMDSGLFTMMFGSGAGKEITKDAIYDWMLRIVSFVKANNIRASVVECDCQKLISPEYAWELRKEMRSLLPNQEIINVFHLEDGKDGFNRLCEFSEYIAISVPELRKAQPKRFKESVCGLAKTARVIKPDIKIHLLGCTDNALLKNNRFCTSADSSSWSFFNRSSNDTYGYHRNQINDVGFNNAMKEIKIEARKQEVAMNEKQLIRAATSYIGASVSRKHYEKYAGKQD